MRESRSAHVEDVPEHLLDELAQTLAEKIDILLDRLADRALAAPTAGTTAWRRQWLDRDSPTGQQQQARRQFVRDALASRAAVTLHSVNPSTTPAESTPTVRPSQRGRRPRRTAPRVDTQQLCIF